MSGSMGLALFCLMVKDMTKFTSPLFPTLCGVKGTFLNRMASLNDSSEKSSPNPACKSM